MFSNSSKKEFEDFFLFSSYGKFIPTEPKNSLNQLLQSWEKIHIDLPSQITILCGYFQSR